MDGFLSRREGVGEDLRFFDGPGAEEDEARRSFIVDAELCGVRVGVWVVVGVG